jgi:H+-transporting ATPase
MIEAAVILSAVAQHWPDFGIILLLLLANAVVGFWEEHQAGNAIAALKAKLAIKTRVKRDGKWTTPEAREVVPGDVIHVRLGDIVPADARLLEGDPIEVDQSALTGESLPATRKPGEAVFSGSIVRQGEIDAIVYATGAYTYFGKTAQLVQEAHTVSHFQRAVLRIGNYLILLAAALVVLILGVALFRGDPMLVTLQFALVLTVAAIPVAMPTVLSVTMAVGARLLARKEAIVTRLAAIEELAGVDVLCSDKTGTLTQNKLTLGDPFSVNAIPADEVILCAALASRADNNDTIDLAVLGGLKNDQAVATVLGVVGVVSAFGLFYLGERIFHLDRAHIQTLMYLKLSVAGHLTIFLTRTRGPFWSHRPALILWVAVLGTQIIATLIAVYGLFMTPLGWGWALFVWGYALVWFLLNDRVKLLAYRVFDPASAPLLAKKPI